MAKTKYVVELTNDCNLTCEVCPRNYIDMKLGYMSMPMFFNILHDVPKGSTVLPFWRGESTLHPRFCDMIEQLKDYDVVLATNGIKVEPILAVLDYLSVINVSIHNQKSYEGYLELKNHVVDSKPSIIASRVEGEPEFVKDSRVYKRHSEDGIWGKVVGSIGDRSGCPRLSESVYSWDGQKGKCCYVWDLKTIDPCKDCDQWMGNGRTL